MAKTDAVLNKKYPDLTELFAKKEQARRERAALSPKEKLEMVEKQRKLQVLLRSAKIIKVGVEKD
jgi:ribosome assembly protein YihI (activator of Der GTPase)